MKRATRLVLYTGLAVVGWRVLRHIYDALPVGGARRIERPAERIKQYRRATERWENEGGATLASRRAANLRK